MPNVAVSGGFDPVHLGHINLLRAAAGLGLVVVMLNSDEWLHRKKGYVFMPWHERAELLREMRSVSRVVEVDDGDGTVREALTRLRPEVFANGGDRWLDDVPEKELCDALGIQCVFGVGGDKIRSSQATVNSALSQKRAKGE